VSAFDSETLLPRRCRWRCDARGLQGEEGVLVVGEGGLSCWLLLNHRMWAWARRLHGGVLQCADTMVRGESLFGVANSGEIW